ncbi:MarR family transcriptional regulator [Mycobacterium dioxanotrophicus]|jgi:DNA-binding MarR family transcriptional regulator|uniref:MarR family transcriptional regulator n=1 Tax=Mycobacterium dioxanotrophicus TaxID=482462 RepID=A0A1Y0C4K1_9MYCO|nr:MarR family transcriptional regulator [Mycobacterium dioxanotrophicus]ART70037.1 MarR family transcriptional regulator [Mycobacterium dioxanotrophicus]
MGREVHHVDEVREVRWLSSQELTAWQSFTLLVARLPAALEQQLQRDFGLSVVEYHVLAGLADAPDRQIRMSVLATLAGSELSRMSHLVKRLEKRGFVRREPDPTDGRYTLAILTDQGESYLAAAAPGHVEEVRRMVLDVLTDADVAALGAISATLNARLDELAPGRST